MPDPADHPRTRHWIEGDLLFRVTGLGDEPDRLVKVRRPYALLGRTEACDLVIADRAVANRHAYFHLDHRGVFVVDLVTRTGTRIGGEERPVGWLAPGDAVEVAGRRIELVRARVAGQATHPPPSTDDLLAEQTPDDLVAVTLEPERPTEAPWALGSELLFLGSSPACGIPITGPDVARTHATIVRTAQGAYLVDLAGRPTRLNDRPVSGAAELRDGDRLALGDARYTIRVEPIRPATTSSPAHLPATIEPPAEASTALMARPELPLRLDPELIPVEAQTALLGWMLGTIQGGQLELLRRQGEFQQAMTAAIQRVQDEHHALMDAHLVRIESIDRELASIRREIERRQHETLPERLPPRVAPLAIRPPASPPPAESGSTAPTTWLLQRATQLEDESRSAWKDLLGRLQTQRRRPS